MGKTVAIIQARMGSQRLPGKVLKTLGDRPVLTHVLERVRQAEAVDEVVVATSVEPQDDPVAAHAESLGVPVFRGSHLDVLDRYHRCAVAHDATDVVRLTADCPLLDPAVIDRVIEHFRATGADYTSNVAPRTFPRGLDNEVFKADALATAWRSATAPAEREHVTPYIRAHPETFTITNLEDPRDLSHHRWTLDTPEDLAFLERLHDGPVPLHMHDILKTLERRGLVHLEPT